MDAVLLLSRLQFAVAVYFHFLFVPLTLGLSILNSADYNPESGQLWYMNTFGPGFNSGSWNLAYEWLSEQDADVALVSEGFFQLLVSFGVFLFFYKRGAVFRFGLSGQEGGRESHTDHSAFTAVGSGKQPIDVENLHVRHFTRSFLRWPLTRTGRLVGPWGGFF
jgi:hypothetical protein